MHLPNSNWELMKIEHTRITLGRPRLRQRKLHRVHQAPPSRGLRMLVALFASHHLSVSGSLAHWARSKYTQTQRTLRVSAAPEKRTDIGEVFV